MTENMKRSIKSRLIFMVASLIAGVFILISIIFNVLITNYIENNATQMLSQSRMFMNDIPEKDQNIPNSPREPHKPDKRLTGKAEAIIISSDYEILSPGNFPVEWNDNTDLTDFGDAAQEQKINLKSNVIEKLITDSRLYYYTAVKNSNTDDSYIVFFINMTDLYGLKERP